MAVYYIITVPNFQGSLRPKSWPTSRCLFPSSMMVGFSAKIARHGTDKLIYCDTFASSGNQIDWRLPPRSITDSAWEVITSAIWARTNNSRRIRHATVTNYTVRLALVGLLRSPGPLKRSGANRSCWIFTPEFWLTNWRQKWPDRKTYSKSLENKSAVMLPDMRNWTPAFNISLVSIPKVGCLLIRTNSDSKRKWLNGFKIWCFEWIIVEANNFERANKRDILFEINGVDFKSWQERGSTFEGTKIVAKPSEVPLYLKKKIKK